MPFEIYFCLLIPAAGLVYKYKGHIVIAGLDWTGIRIRLDLDL